jgi:hypothetical protein
MGVVLFPRHLTAQKREQSISHIQTFRDYFHYHIKAAKVSFISYLQAVSSNPTNTTPRLTCTPVCVAVLPTSSRSSTEPSPSRRKRKRRLQAEDLSGYRHSCRYINSRWRVKRRCDEVLGG